jgi:phosphoribosylformylglycinamidine synthase
MDAKRAGDRVYLLGATRAELGGAHYLGLYGLDGGRVPRPDLERAPRLLRALHAAIARGLVRACHDLSEGGLAVAAAEMAFAGELGLALELARVPFEDAPGERARGASAPRVDADAVRLYSESCTRFLVEVEPSAAPAFEALVAGLPCAAVGRVDDTRRLSVTGVAGAPLFAVEIDALRAAHRGGFAG